ncbi:hypothetical protein Ltuc_1828 [Legionella tucsonensis]|uniref:Uncharacterized protein n=1 Tax=Legionella tucsonensis TaxID=40335 RepID=A0A0W0ZXY7_9GAMM|nr:hypothetical protein Ltuc_1828 [Legionella tucsonensis]
MSNKTNFNSYANCESFFRTIPSFISVSEILSKRNYRIRLLFKHIKHNSEIGFEILRYLPLTY